MEKINDKINGVWIDTCYEPLHEKLETAIAFNEFNYIPVEYYSSDEKAKKGHQKWIRFIKKNYKTFKPENIYFIQEKYKIIDDIFCFKLLKTKKRD